MPSRAWKLRIQDTLESVSAVESYVTRMTFEEFAGSITSFLEESLAFRPPLQGLKISPSGSQGVALGLPYLALSGLARSPNGAA